MLTCQQITELITDFLEGRLSWRDRVKFQLHLGLCRNCRAYLRQMKLTLETLGRLPPLPPPDQVREELLRRFVTWK
jgi:predicted anti-sigma-YlaC factor YlaD